MSVVSLRRYPVKSMGGEALEEARLDARGVVSDRWYAVEDGAGHFASGKSTRRFRRHDEVFDYAAATGATGDVVVTRGHRTWRVGDPGLDADLTRRFGEPVRVTPEAAVPHQDMGSVSLVGTATLAWCAERWHLDADPRRLRVNVVVATHEPFVEETWLGRELACGEARLRVVERVPRCRVVDVDQDGVRAEGRWLRRIAAERDLHLAVYADVVGPGVLRVGDPLTVR